MRKDQPKPGSIELFIRLTRAQFIPLVILPAAVGTSLAFSVSHAINFVFFGLVLLGVIVLHLGANAVDDAYDYQNGVDSIANQMFPEDFGGWKPIPRGYVSLGNGKLISFALFGLGLAVGLYFWYVVGAWAFVLALVGTILAIFYCAPPLRLDYRGLALGEAAIFFAFGPVPVLGAFYVQTGYISLDSFLVSIPIGLMTVTILIDHDLIFYEVYAKSRKLSLATVLGREKALQISLSLTIVSYAIVLALVGNKILPIWSLSAPLLSGLMLARKWRVFSRPNEPPPFYVPFAQNGILSNWLFSLALALSILV